MATGILGRKIGMTQIYTEEGRAIPVTVIEAGPCKVLQVRTQERDGYSAIQIGFADKASRLPGLVTSPAVDTIACSPTAVTADLTEYSRGAALLAPHTLDALVQIHQIPFGSSSGYSIPYA